MGAYILFYQKSCLSPASSSSSSSSGSGQDHWVYRMPDFTYKTKSEMKCAPTAKPRPTKKEAKKTVQQPSSKPGTPGTGQKFVRNSAKYATLPAKRTSKIIHLDTEHHSENEHGGKEESSDEEEEEESTSQPEKSEKTA